MDILNNQTAYVIDGLQYFAIPNPIFEYLSIAFLVALAVLTLKSIFHSYIDDPTAPDLRKPLAVIALLFGLSVIFGHYTIGTNYVLPKYYVVNKDYLDTVGGKDKNKALEKLRVEIDKETYAQVKEYYEKELEAQKEMTKKYMQEIKEKIK